MFLSCLLVVMLKHEKHHGRECEAWDDFEHSYVDLCLTNTFTVGLSYVFKLNFKGTIISRERAIIRCCCPSL